MFRMGVEVAIGAGRWLFATPPSRYHPGMCGRYTNTMTWAEMVALYEIHNIEFRPNFDSRFNIAPTQSVPVVRLGDDGNRQLAMLRWGLLPSWSKDAAMGAKMINARSETVAEKPSFREAFRSRRCLVPADGFYEWRTEEGHKQPFRIGMKGGVPFAFAGLWEQWTAPVASTGIAEGEIVESFTIVTTVANDKLRPIHARMPVILGPETIGQWLDAANDQETLLSLLQPYPADPMAFYRVSTAVNNVRNDDPSCIAPLTANAG